MTRRLLDGATHRALAAAAGLLALAGLPAIAANADDVHVAVTSSFTGTAQDIGAAFSAATGHRAIYSFGSTGQLYNQIAHGAPFEVYLAADRARPEKAVAEGYGIEGTVFTYATGRLVLFSIDGDRVTGPETLEAGAFDKIAIANPETAPYGAAAVEAMTALGVRETLAPKIVMGENVGQAYQFVATHNAELGFVALAQVLNREDGSRWIVPREFHAPIDQDAVLLTNGADNPVASAYLDFLRSPEGRAIIEGHGYGTGD